MSASSAEVSPPSPPGPAIANAPSAAPTACGNCGSEVSTANIRDLQDYLSRETFHINQCNGCGLQRTQPLPIGEAIGRYYPPTYRGNRHAFTGPMRSALRRRSVEKNFAKGFKGRLLDIGCGDGSFARHMHRHGWDVCATEIDPDTVDRLCREGIDAKLSHHADRDGFEKPFDAITCWHVMEHLEHPRQVAEWAKTQLADRGIFQATVPNAASFQARLFGRHWVHLDVPRHRQHYSPSTFKAVLTQAGFSIQHQSSFALEYDWFGIIQSVLNTMCSRPNVLFDKLTHAPIDAGNPPSVADQCISYALSPFVAGASLPMMVLTSALGDGATLTLTCRK